MYNNINLIHSSIERRQRRKRKTSLKSKIIKIFLSLLAIYFVISFILSSKVIFSQDSFTKVLTKLPVVNQIRTILGAEDILNGQDDDRINILLMGIGGSGHDGALLTDTIMLASIKLSTNEITLISIPRDLYIKIHGNGWRRINYASAYGDLINYKGGGSALMAKTVEETFGVPIDYWLRIDFSGFKQAIDNLGGIDVIVDKTFTDNQFPTDDFGVQTLTFEQGPQHMNGERALQFARSRHGNNGEGSDFARSKRQQKILIAVKNKILNWKTLANPNRLYNIYDNVKNHIQTNIKPSQLTELMGLLKGINFDLIKHYVIDDAPGGLLKPIITDDGAQVLAPKSGDLTELQDFVKNIFVVRDIKQNDIKIILANGTTIDGLATYMGSSLSSWGFSIERLITAPQQDFEKTVIYKLANNKTDIKQNKEALKILKRRLQANATDKIPELLKPLLYRLDSQGQQQQINANFLVVIGTDQQRAIKAVEEWNKKQVELEAKKKLEQENNKIIEETGKINTDK